MKASTVVIIAALLGCALGTGISVANFGLSGAALQMQATVEPPLPNVGAQPKLLVDSKHHDFGVVDRDVTVRHVFEFTNRGEGVLKLKRGGTSCTRCTITELAKDEVAPGETVGVTVEYLTAYAQPQFSQTATILTNDPAEPRVELNIYGTVRTRYRVVPSSVVLSKVSANESKATYVTIFSYLSDQVELVSHGFSEPESAQYFEVRGEPVAKDKIMEPDAKGACRVEVLVKPGLPWGPIRQRIRLELKMSGDEKNTELELPVMGTVDSDISLVGRGWHADTSRLVLGSFPRAEGASRTVSIMVHGPHRNDVQVRLLKADPEWLQVTLGEPTKYTDVTVQIPLTVAVPPGSPPGSHLGVGGAPVAEVLLETTHPQVREIRMNVQFLIEQ